MQEQRNPFKIAYNRESSTLLLSEMKRLFWLMLVIFLFHGVQSEAKNVSTPMQCVAFSPYVNDLSPNNGPVPSVALIDTLLGNIAAQTPFRCIMTYGVLNGLEAIFPIAKQHGLKVIAILWIDKDKNVNTDSISHGIALAKQYPDTITRISCGSELRTRHDYALDSETERCLQALREAKVSQPIGVIDTWWEWCNRAQPCHQNQFSAQVDWIGINVFPWWENKHSGLFPCVSAQNAADFHLARWQEVKKTHPDKEVVLTEFGWPNAPHNKAQVHIKTGASCGRASKKNQQEVIEQTFKKLKQTSVSGVAFEAFSEIWKPTEEGESGRYWGLCEGLPPYTCQTSSLHINP